MIACPQGVLQRSRPGTWFSCVAMAMKPAMHTPQSPAKLGMWVSGDISAKLYHAAERNLSLGQWESRCKVHLVQPNDRRGWDTKNKKRRGHTHEAHLHWDEDVYCTFVSRTDIILSLASLTFSLFPHTLMCGSAGKKKRSIKSGRGRVCLMCW